MKNITKDILYIIPARSGSKGIKNKNLQKIGKKSLVKISLELAQKVSKISDIVFLSTDSDKIAKEAVNTSAVVPFLRLKKLARDTSSIPDVIENILSFYKKDNIFFNWIVLLQPTAPFRRACDIKNSILIGKKQNCDGVISVCEDQAIHPFLIQKIEDGFLRPFIGGEYNDSQRQSLYPKSFIRNGAIYMMKVKSFEKSKSLKFGKIKPYVMPIERSINIDNALDLELAKAFHKTQFKKQ